MRSPILSLKWVQFPLQHIMLLPLLSVYYMAHRLAQFWCKFQSGEGSGYVVSRLITSTLMLQRSIGSATLDNGRVVVSAYPQTTICCRKQTLHHHRHYNDYDLCNMKPL